MPRSILIALTGLVTYQPFSALTDPNAVAPITTTVRGLSTEVPAGPGNGLDHDSIVSCDNIVTVLVDALGRQLGYLLTDQEPALSEAIRTAFDRTESSALAYQVRV